MIRDFFQNFRKKKAEIVNAENFPLHTDIHSHLLPGLDDGVKSFEEAVEVIKGLAGMGFKKLITTPHIMGDYYKNDSEGIAVKLEELKEKLEKNQVDIEIEAAAEYFLDEWFETKLKEKKVLTFGNNYVLVETSFLNKPYNFEDILFNIQASGYKPVLAHPERYSFIENHEELNLLHEKGVLFQVNITSLEGNSTLKSIKTIKYLIEKNMIDFLATDVHNLRQLKTVQAAIQSEMFQKITALDLINKSEM